MRLRHARAWIVLLASCGTVDPGDNFIPPDIVLDEDVFHCIVQPMVISPQRCASGGSGEAGMCHAARSALILRAAAETDPPPDCSSGRPASVPTSYADNFRAVQISVQADALSSPLYRRPTGLSSHPRVIFPTSSREACLIAAWIDRTPLEDCP
ncbi:MAG: hypothetical protein NZ898_15710 [Myxococcota bacterium]|nr:hypothetical protein [Myxococcota bacterium]MDW8363971.1 hypothetical protein [Myxococcales bacterium]